MGWNGMSEAAFVTASYGNTDADECADGARVFAEVHVVGGQRDRPELQSEPEPLALALEH